MESQQEVSIVDKIANPAPLGLLGFGMTTVLLNIHNAGGYELGSMILGMGIFYGGIAQIIAGILEFKKNNVFGATAFTSFGSFWLTFVALKIMPQMGLVAAPENSAVVCYLLMWGLFTGCMFIATLKLTRSLQFIFGSLTILFLLLALGDATESADITKIAGLEGIICGFSAFYTAIAQIINEVYGEEKLPL